MDGQEIEAKVREVICALLEVPPERVVGSAQLIADLGADSIAVVELAIALEEAFKVEIPDEDTEQIRTVDDAVNYLKAHVK